jgi:hypothetical protein
LIIERVQVGLISVEIPLMYDWIYYYEKKREGPAAANWEWAQTWRTPTHLCALLRGHLLEDLVAVDEADGVHVLPLVLVDPLDLQNKEVGKQSTLVGMMRYDGCCWL